MFPDRMQVVVRTSYGLAWKILGESAPVLCDPSGQVMSKAMLMQRLQGLFKVTEGGVEMMPRTAGCRFEPNDQVTFVLSYPRALKVPVVLSATYLEDLGPTGQGTVAVFDHTTGLVSDRFQPLACKVLSGGDPALSVAVEDALPAGQPALLLEQPRPGGFPLLTIGRIVTGFGHVLVVLMLLLVCRFLLTSRLWKAAGFQPCLAPMTARWWFSIRPFPHAETDGRFPHDPF